MKKENHMRSSKFFHVLHSLVTLLTITTLVTTALAACGTNQPTSPTSTSQGQTTKTPIKPKKDQEKTHTITFDPFFVQHFMRGEHDNTPADVAKGLEEQGKDSFPKADAQPDGSVSTILTDKQLNNDIDWYTKGRQQSIDLFKRAHTSTPPDYHYQLSKDGRELTVWLDKNMPLDNYSAILVNFPLTSGYLYYLNGGTGPWDMHITINNVHTGRTVQELLASQIPGDFDRNAFGD
ncbi:hypothetical protein OZX72_00115 [Bifidobacterium sp. ESL0769]|uniref:hypothetical protein n=1 Tax=Bifidobacterium sp. ESL0769 TaxID=2983229 RepID=UPI0023F6DA41|nr:hypothetical protein [Bifidobacterium sp. ESL0769]WEV67460.1 hypothetical protein OZX72_00115 [Bifidobacterium sp. ESL0769]